MNSWLITGGCGFIGSSLIEYLLLKNNRSIRIIDNLSVGTRNDLRKVCKFSEKSADEVIARPEGIELVVADVRNQEDVVKAARGCDVVVHLAANTGVGPSVLDPKKDCNVNVNGVVNLLEATRKQNIDRFIFASSGAPAGNIIPPIHENIVPRPISPYGASKLAGEGYCSAYHHSYGISTVALRFSNVYGPGSIHKSSVVAQFIRKAMSKEDIIIYGDGSQTRDFIYVGDLVSAIYLAANTSNIGGELIQIASGVETSLNDLFHILSELFSSGGVSELSFKYMDPRVGDVARNFADISKAKKILQWTPTTDLNNGLKHTVDYFSHYMNL